MSRSFDKRKTCLLLQRLTTGDPTQLVWPKEPHAEPLTSRLFCLYSESFQERSISILLLLESLHVELPDLLARHPEDLAKHAVRYVRRARVAGDDGAKL